MRSDAPATEENSVSPESAASEPDTAEPRTRPEEGNSTSEPLLVDPTGAPVQAPPATRPTDSEQGLPEPSPGPVKRRWVWVLVGIVVVLALAYLVLHSQSKARETKAVAEKKARAAAIPVAAVAARTGDFPVHLVGLGTITALNTVTVRTRVDGQLLRVAFSEGQFVRAGDLLAEIDPRPFQVQLTQAEGQKAKDEAALKNAKLDLERYRVLFAQDSVPRQQLDTQAATVAQDEAAIKTDQGAVDSAKLNLTYTRITAPISGRVGLRLVDAGNMVHASDANGLLVITQVQPIAALFTIAEDSLPAVLQKTRSGQHLRVEAFDRDQDHQLATGELLTVDNQIDTTTGTVRLKATFPNQDNRLYPNQFVNVRLQLDTLRGVVIIPTAALQRSPQSTYVYVVKPDQTVTMRPVEVQLTEGDSTAIRQGVGAGELLVVEGLDKLHEGSKVAVQQPGGRQQPGGKKRPEQKNPPPKSS